MTPSFGFFYLFSVFVSDMLSILPGLVKNTEIQKGLVRSHHKVGVRRYMRQFTKEIQTLKQCTSSYYCVNAEHVKKCAH